MNKNILSGGIIIGLLMIMALLSLISSDRYKEQEIYSRLQPPSFGHIMGTDELGRDVFSRIIKASGVSMSVGITSVSIASILGIIIGLISGYFGGRIDGILMRFTDIMLTIPVLFLILILVVFLGPSIVNIIVIIGITSWTDIARIIRAEVMRIKSLPYIEAAAVLGLEKKNILLKHIMPNAISPAFVYITFGVSGAILAESGLSFLGLGVQPPEPSWGNMLTSGKDYIDTAWWLVLFPGIFIFFAVLGFNLLGEGIRDLLDPRMKNE